MMDVAVFDPHVFRVDLNTITLAVPDRAVPQHNTVRNNAHQVVLTPLLC